jgi:predicted dehydrogenase
MSEPLRIGLVGCGGIARAHVNAYKNEGGNAIVAVCDTHRASAEAMAAQTGATVVASPADMVKGQRLDAVSVCTPPAAHYENCLPFLKARIPVLCEKPLGRDGADAARLAAAVATSGSLLMTAFCHRFHPPVIELKRIIGEGTLGAPLLFRNVFGGYLALKGNHRADPQLSGGGPLIDHCCHSVDLFRFLVGEPTHVTAMTGNIMQELPIEDFGIMLLSVGGKSFGEITGSYSLPGCENWVEWYGTKGVARISYFVAGVPELTVRVGDGAWQTIDVAGRPDRFTAEVAHFLTCVRSGATPAMVAADGLAANRIVDAAYRSVREGRQVTME